MSNVCEYERPGVRRLIVERGYSPWLEKGKWDRYNAKERDGGKVMLDERIRLQMKIMIEEGYWDEEFRLLRQDKR